MKKYFILLTLLVIVSLTFLIARKNQQKPFSAVVAGSTLQQIVTPAPATSQETLCKNNAFTAPLPSEITTNRLMAEDPYVQYLRTAINGYINSSYTTGGEYNGLVDGVHHEDSVSVFGEIERIGEDYLKSKFIVLETDPAPFGGESIVLIFKDKPDQVFYAWVYDYTDGKGHHQGYDLRGFSVYDAAENGAPDIQTTQKTYINQICDPDFGI